HIDMTALHLGRVHILHLPAECFVEYQLYAQQFGAYLSQSGMRNAERGMNTATAASIPHSEFRIPNSAEGELANPFIAVAAYGDCGPAYIPLAESYPQGGYEVTMAWVGPGSEAMIKTGIRDLLLQGAV